MRDGSWEEITKVGICQLLWQGSKACALSGLSQVLFFTRVLPSFPFLGHKKLRLTSVFQIKLSMFLGIVCTQIVRFHLSGSMSWNGQTTQCVAAAVLETRRMGRGWCCWATLAEVQLDLTLVDNNIQVIQQGCVHWNRRKDSPPQPASLWWVLEVLVDISYCIAS